MLGATGKLTQPLWDPLGQVQPNGPIPKLVSRLLKKAGLLTCPTPTDTSPALRLLKKPLHPATRRSADKAAVPRLTLVSRFTFHGF
jgi:hypothetical protein